MTLNEAIEKLNDYGSVMYNPVTLMCEYDRNGYVEIEGLDVMHSCSMSLLDIRGKCVAIMQRYDYVFSEDDTWIRLSKNGDGTVKIEAVKYIFNNRYEWINQTLNCVIAIIFLVLMLRLFYYVSENV